MGNMRFQATGELGPRGTPFLESFASVIGSDSLSDPSDMG